MDVREMSHESTGRLMSDGDRRGETKAELIGDYLDSQGWEAHYPDFLLDTEEAFIKGHLMLLVDEIGVFIYKNGGRKWERIGGLSYLKMKNFPLCLFGYSQYELDLEKGVVKLKRLN